jgi:hypothetical protein
VPVITIGENPGDSFAGITDTELTQGSPTSNSNTSETIEITKFGSGDHRDALFVISFSAFRTSISNASITVNSASFSMWATAISHGALVIGVYQSLRAAVAAQATWNVFSTGNSWTSGGGRGNGTDRVTTALGALTTPSNGQYNAASLTAASVETLINAGSALILTLERTDAQNDGNFSVWRSSNNSTTTERPFLSLDYTLASAGQPTSGRSNGVPGMRIGGQTFGRGW